MIGVDEVGRGAWAGPLVIAGCYFPENTNPISGLNDSKKVSRSKREKLSPLIKSSTIFKIVTISNKHIDKYGLSYSIRKGILEILDYMPKDKAIMLDGNFNFLKNTKFEERVLLEVGADSKYPSVMAASILAKVERDKLMRVLETKYPGYGFKSNVGYGTAEHRVALSKLGPSVIHRKSFKPIKGQL